MKMLAAFLPFFIVTLCAISCVSALPSTQDQEIVRLLKNIADTLGHPCPKTPPNGWTRFDNYCYLVSSSIKSWHQARKYCRSKGGDLVKINYPAENEFVLNLVKKKAPSLKQVWIGLNWVSSSRAFYWYDNSVPVYKNWAPREPSGNAREPCSNMWTGRTGHFPYQASGFWNDLACNVRSDIRNGIVCKRLP